jgi:AcrR family transcriptional regulator
MVRRKDPIHPTRMLLIDTTVSLLDIYSLEELSAEMVLKSSGVSKGSMYHFFPDFSSLLEAAFLQRFSRHVEQSIAAIESIVDLSSNQEEFFTKLEAVTIATQSEIRRVHRFERARILAKAERNERFKNDLALVQQHLTDSLADCFAQAQQQGWLNTSFEPRTGAVYIQAYTLGKIVDDISPTPMDPDDWNALIMRIARLALG